MLEDHAGYVLRKALLGQGITPAEAAARAGVSLETVERFFAGGFDRDAARALARVLELDEEAFAAHADYLPKPVRIDGVHQLDLPFGEDQVNAWLLRKGDTVVLVDAGATAESLLEILAEQVPCDPTALLITHGHHDHVAGLGALGERGVPAMGARIDGAAELRPDESHQIGELTFRTCDLSGHYAPALGFLFDGFSQPVFAVGDAIFAGSIGGCKTPEIYRMALRTILDACRDLPDETVILPGHGPATTLGEERRSNPFLVGRV
jgi:glyoxylase-like metal-dependent hydrolase (beta-lactamase superfamily II)